jgi:uncharacterized phage protein gp47/JayE
VPAEAQVVYKDRDAIVADLAAALQARVPDANLDMDTIWRIWIETMSLTIEGLYLANQLLHNDMFIQTANGVALIRFGEMFGRSIEQGTKATGTVRFEGAGGATIDIGAQVAAPRSQQEALLFNIIEAGTIPDPGVPTAPTLADSGTSGNPTAGTYNYVVTFYTLEGETTGGEESDALITSSAHQINVSAIPIGGPGTIGRKLYRAKNGGVYQFVTQISNNTATTFTDNVADVSLGVSPPEESTAERLTLDAEADAEGSESNVAVGTITDVASITPGITGVVNTVAFTGGTDEEDIETFRNNLLQWVRAPQSGSPQDMVAWAINVRGVEQAAAFPGDNLGTPTAGHVTVRISGPDGTIPDSSVVDAVQAELLSKDLANITIHTATFTPVTVAAAVTITVEPDYVLADLTPQIQTAIANYINHVPVGGTVYRSGIIDAVFGLPGVATLSVTTPATDTTTTSTQKAVAGTITVS